MAMKVSGAKKIRASRDNTSMKPVVFLRSEEPKPITTAWRWTMAFHGRPLVFLIIATIAVTSLAMTASGTSFDYYPETCLGSWKSPENAQGTPSIKTNIASAKQFNQNNSAVFFGGTHSIICQAFGGQSIPDDATLSSLSLKLSLAVKHPLVPTTEEQIPEEESASETSGSSSGGDSSDDAEFFIVDQPVTESDGDSTEATEAEEPASESPAVESVIEPAEEGVAKEESAAESEPTAEPEPEPVSEPDPEPTSEPVSEPESPAFRIPFIHKASAQEQADVLATVFYSLDGDDWQALGHITQESWQNLEFRIPVGEGGVMAVADIPNLRIRIDAGFFGVDNPTEVYLDGMTVEINTDEYVSDEEFMRLNEVGAVPGIFNSGKSVTQTFSLSRSIIPSEEVLSWQPYDYQIKNEAAAEDVTRSVATIDSRTEDIILSGSCKQEYFTVLVFRSPEAYATAPRTALFNSAYPCDNGLYSYRLTPVSLKLPAGVYYLLVAEQSEGQPWVPISAIMPFTIEEQVVN